MALKSPYWLQIYLVNKCYQFVDYDMGWFSKNRTYMGLKEIIKENGIKQSWIAKKLGISAPYLSLILNRKRRLTENMEDNFNLLIERIKGERR